MRFRHRKEKKHRKRLRSFLTPLLSKHESYHFQRYAEGSTDAACTAIRYSHCEDDIRPDAPWESNDGCWNIRIQLAVVSTRNNAFQWLRDHVLPQGEKWPQHFWYMGRVDDALLTNDTTIEVRDTRGERLQVHDVQRRTEGDWRTERSWKSEH